MNGLDNSHVVLELSVIMPLIDGSRFELTTVSCLAGHQQQNVSGYFAALPTTNGSDHR